MAAKKWAAFPHANKAFDYSGDKLHKHWATSQSLTCTSFPSSLVKMIFTTNRYKFYIGSSRK